MTIRSPTDRLILRASLRSDHQPHILSFGLVKKYIDALPQKSCVMKPLENGANVDHTLSNGVHLSRRGHRVGTNFSSVQQKTLVSLRHFRVVRSLSNSSPTASTNYKVHFCAARPHDAASSPVRVVLRRQHLVSRNAVIEVGRSNNRPSSSGFAEILSNLGGGRFLNRLVLWTGVEPVTFSP